MPTALEEAKCGMCFASPEKYQEWKLLAWPKYGFFPLVEVVSCQDQSHQLLVLAFDLISQQTVPHTAMKCSQSLNPLMGKLIHWTPPISLNSPKLLSVGSTLLWHRTGASAELHWTGAKTRITSWAHQAACSKREAKSLFKQQISPHALYPKPQGKKYWVDMPGVADQTSASVCPKPEHGLQWLCTFLTNSSSFWKI